MRTPRRGDIYYIGKNPYRPTHGCVMNSARDHDVRPAIIVSNDQNNASAYILEVVYLTTSPKKDLPTHCTIRSANRVSTAICEQITTISDEQLVEYMATCTEEEMRMVDACMAISLGLDMGYDEEDETECYDYDDETESLADEITRLQNELAAAQIEVARAQKGEELYKAAYKQVLDRLLER